MLCVYVEGVIQMLKDKVYRFQAKIYYNGGSNFWWFQRPYSVQLYEQTMDIYRMHPTRLEGDDCSANYNNKEEAIKAAKYWAVKVIKRRLKEQEKRNRTETIKFEIEVEVKDGKVIAK